MPEACDATFATIYYYPISTTTTITTGYSTWQSSLTAFLGGPVLRVSDCSGARWRLSLVDPAPQPTPGAPAQVVVVLLDIVALFLINRPISFLVFFFKGFTTP